MPFLRGSLAFERFSVAGFEAEEFGEEHLEILANNAAGRFETNASENIHVGFLGGQHLFDLDFDLSKNVINNAAHFSVRIDTNQIPAAIRAAWLKIELAALAKDNDSGVPTKAQRKEAKEAVEQRCEVEAATGKYRKMQQFSMLWDIASEQLYFGGSMGPSSGHCIDLLERSFNVECSHVGAGSIARAWSSAAKRYAEVDDLMPSNFVNNQSPGTYAWTNEHSHAPDFLGNEFLMWLWWKLETETDTIALPDDSEVTIMLNKTLTLECPFGETGKETMASECPVKLPEALQAIRTGKLPRKSGMTLVRDGRQFDLVLQAESFGISGAKIHLDEDEEFCEEDRIDTIRQLSETTDLLLHVFLDVRSGKAWNKEQAHISKWLHSTAMNAQEAAA